MTESARSSTELDHSTVAGATVTTPKIAPWTTAGACVQRVDHGAGKPLTLAECVEQVEHPLTGHSRAELVEIIAFLSAQVVGYQHNQNADAALAMVQIASAVREYQARQS